MVQARLDKRWVILGSLVLSRTIYSVNWFNISPALPLIAVEMNVSITQLGLLATAFLFGIGIFQIPAGILAARIGSRNTAMLGLVLYSIFATLSGAAPGYEALLLARFLTGACMSLVFGPAIALFTPLFNTRERGLALGLFNSAFSLGGVLGLSVWAYLAATIGWRMALILGGLLGLILAVQNIMITRKVEDTAAYRSPVSMRDLSKVIRHKDVWLLALALTGAGSGWYVVMQFGVIYIINSLGASLVAAGFMTSLLELTSMFGNTLGGRVSDLLGERIKLILLFNIFIAAGVIIISIPDFGMVLLGLGFMGFSAGATYTVTYLAVSEYGEISVRYKPLAIALTNSTQLLGGSISPTLFAFTVEFIGFSGALLLLGFVSVLPSAGLLLIRSPLTTD